MATKKVAFPSASGSQLAAEIDLPQGVIRGIALFAHCFSCGKDLKSVKRLSSRLVEHGLAVLRFDFTGLGGSDGDFADTNFSSNVTDLLSAADWLRQTYSPPTLLIGHSLGGSAAIVAASRIPELQALATIGAPSDPAHVTHLFEPSIERIIAEGEADVCLAGRTFSVKKQFLHDVQEQNLDAALGELSVPLLVMHAPVDDIVSVDNGERIFAAAHQPKSYASLDGADHLLTHRSTAERTADQLATWAITHLPEMISPSDDVLQSAAEGEVLVAERGIGAFTQVVRVAERHALLADEPIGIGDDLGPAPYDLLLAALGTCTSMTVRMYANRKGWPLEDISIHLSHDRVHAADCDECESTEGRVDVINRRVRIVGPDLDDEQRAALLAIADKCPVHRTLENEIHITTEAV